MIRNGPRTRLNNAPGRRTTSMTSFVTKDVVRVQLLSSPTNIAILPILVFDHELGKDFVEAREVLAALDHLPTGRADLLQHARCGSAGLVGDYHQVARCGLLDGA